MTNQDKHLLNHLINLMNTYKRRHRVLELQAAKFGIHVPPHIILELEDIKEKILEMESQLKKISDKSDNLPISQNTSANQININGNISESTIIIGNENKVEKPSKD